MIARAGTKLAATLVFMCGMFAFAPQTALADDTPPSGGSNTCPTLLILKSWFCGLVDSSGNVKKVTSDGSDGGISLTAFIWTIVANVVDDIFRIIGLVATGYLIWGGYQYMLARGDPGKLGSAKKTIQHAITGLIIAILASSIVNVVMRVIFG
jgi:hypothetical protein